MATYVVAVSGGVDSVVLLDILTRSDHRLIVAHVEHGIRGDDSAADARFVEALARTYQLPFVSTSLGLGKRASEDLARQKRYDFLFATAREYHATVVTAHHLDDVVETVALNIERGTGWRGLAVLARVDTLRPLIALTKQQLYQYALKHRLEWVEDATNATDVYQRNRLRHKIAARLSISDRQKIANLRSAQLTVRTAIARETARILAKHEGSRHFLAQLDIGTAVELLGTAIEQTVGVRPLRTQLERGLLAIKTARPGTVHHVGSRVQLHFSARKYRVTVL